MPQKNHYLELQTKVKITPNAIQLSHPDVSSKPDAVMLIGSCFTENIGARLADYGFRTLVNPFGIVYNPLSIAECLRRCQQGIDITEADLVCYKGIFHSWAHHGAFSNGDKKLCLETCNNKLHEASKFLAQGCTLIVTLGTAYCYFLNDGSKRPVANCHKLPACNFTKRLLSVNEIIQAFASLPHCPTIFTVSPIRHLADTLQGNQLSKSTLLLAIHELLPSTQTDNLRTYFPAYEIMMDELRDYRFYDTDMLHPTQLAVDIIWERFEQAFMDAPTRQLGKKFQLLHKMEAHRPLYPDSEDSQKLLQRIALLRKELNL